MESTSNHKLVADSNIADRASITDILVKPYMTTIPSTQLLNSRTASIRLRLYLTTLSVRRHKWSHLVRRDT